MLGWAHYISHVINVYVYIFTYFFCLGYFSARKFYQRSVCVRKIFNFHILILLERSFKKGIMDCFVVFQ